MSRGQPRVRVTGLGKRFTLHTQGGVQLPVFSDLALEVGSGECVALTGPSGCGKSTLLRSLYANYLPTEGRVEIRHGDDWVDLGAAPPHAVVHLRRHAIGYVSQFLRVIPRVATLDLVLEPLLEAGVDEQRGAERARRLLARLNLPQFLWSLPPATFSGGEQQRVNLARVFVFDYPVLLLDEPTAALDAENRQAVVELIAQARSRGAAIVGIFHDQAVRDTVSDRCIDVSQYRAAA